jgi:hypothetical protein
MERSFMRVCLLMRAATNQSQHDAEEADAPAAFGS